MWWRHRKGRPTGGADIVRDVPQLAPAVPAPGVCDHSPGRSLLIVGKFTLDGMTPRARRNEGQALSQALRQHPELIRGLEQARTKRQRHLAAAHEELAHMVSLAAAALEAGASIAEVAELAGMSRPTMYRLLSHRPQS